MIHRLMYLVSLSFGFAVSSSGQPELDDFFITGQTHILGDYCFQLTPDEVWSSGGIWYKTPIDLRESFDIQLQLRLGCKDIIGADGMVFVFTPYRGASGYQGEGMGFAGLKPSLGIEVDTWQNDHLADPLEDHVAIMRDGYVDHYFNLAGPKIINDLEDCALHAFSMIWNSDEKRLALLLDGEEIISMQEDILAEIFYNEPMVYMGVTAATGRYSNRHEICFERIEIVPPLADALFGRVVQSKLSRGIVTKLDDLRFEGDGWTRESDKVLYQLYNLLEKYPDYTLELDVHARASQNKTAQEVSEQRAQNIRDFLLGKKIDKKKLEFRGLGDDFISKELGYERVEVRLIKSRT